MAKMQFRGRFNTPESAQAFADTCSNSIVQPDGGKWAVYTPREKPAPIERANKGVFERKPNKKAFPKGRAENEIEK